MEVYIDKIKQHLAEYKCNRLGVEWDGIYKKNGKRYGHILPLDLWKLNLIETYRSELADYLVAGKIDLHSCNHLNSSQILCFNLLYPLIYESMLLPALAAGLDMPELQTLDIATAEFEKITDQAEKTNFDFYIQFENNRQLFFELKYTEGSFGSAKNDRSHLRKLEKVYLPRLDEKLATEKLSPEYLLKNYQLMRNISYLSADTDDSLIILAPQHRAELRKEFDLFMEHVDSSIRSRVCYITLEDFTERISGALAIEPTLPRVHLELFKEKYLPEV
jgi:hypothetical protein